MDAFELTNGAGEREISEYRAVPFFFFAMTKVRGEGDSGKERRKEKRWTRKKGKREEEKDERLRRGGQFRD